MDKSDKHQVNKHQAIKHQADKDRAGKHQAAEGFSFDTELLDILVCPVTKTSLRYDEAAQELISDKGGFAYPIRDGIPVMLVDQARRLQDKGKKQGKQGKTGGNRAETGKIGEK